MPGTEVTRRRLLAGASGAAAATAGCFSRLRSRITYDPADQLSLSLKALPADDDPASVRLAQELRRNLEAVGIEVSLELLGRDQLLRDVLVNHEFDLFVAELPGHHQPDELRSFLHSRFAVEEGWQNPMGHASRALDRLTEAQRRPDAGDRSALLADLQHELVHSHPVSPLVSRTHATAHSPALRLPDGFDFSTPLSYVAVEDDARDPTALRVALLRHIANENFNVLNVESRAEDLLADLLYDTLARRIGGEYVPWLAREWTVDGSEHAITVTLREGLTRHDGQALSAEDVAFTYRFLADTSLGSADSPVPAPRHRHQTSLVEDAEAIDDRTLQLQLRPCREALYPTVLEVPVLPADQWRERSEFEHEYLTRAIVGNVEEPVGTGPFRFDSVEPDQSLTLTRFDDHFLRRAADLPDELDPFAGGPAYERIEATMAPNPGTAIDDVAGGDVDVYHDPLSVEGIADARGRPDVSVQEVSTPAYYCLGCNVREHPLSNYAFRAALGALFDREHLASDVFDGHATPIESPLHATEWVPADLEWSGESVAAPFAGEAGELDVDAAQQRFRDAGFRYHEGELRG